MCGELFAVRKMKLGEAPGMNTVLKPETLGSTLIGLNRCWSSACENVGFFGRTPLDSLKNCNR